MEKEMVIKIQYNNFEAGEFVYNQLVNFENARSVILSFPWEEERRKLHVDLTNPSITFQTDNGLFLKLALFYNGKFILYYYDGKHLFTHSFVNLEASFSFIEYFFIHQDIDRSQYKLESTWLKNLKINFISQDFFYTTANKTFFQLMDNWTRGLLIFDFIFFVFFILKFETSTAAILGLLFFILVAGGINLILHINHYINSKDQTLVLSKGSDSFLFGDCDAPIKYFKKDIQQITIEKNTARKCPWNDFTISNLELKNGEVLKISSILLHGYEIERKFPDIISKTKAVFIPNFHRHFSI